MTVTFRCSCAARRGFSTTSRTRGTPSSFAHFAQRLAQPTQPTIHDVALPPLPTDPNADFRTTHFIPGKFSQILREEAWEASKLASPQQDLSPTETPLRVAKPHKPRSNDTPKPISKYHGRLASRIQSAIVDVIEDAGGGSLHPDLHRGNLEILHVVPSGSGKTYAVYYRNVEGSTLEEDQMDILVKMFEVPLRRMVMQRLQKGAVGFPNLEFKRETGQQERKEMEGIMERIERELAG
ncbi:hypothetical protein HKX48_002913 [Thoreauomyces humboldtii]|nr:hypothetical protein HKX48_002913 [Thoreauomyces humboldtii]